VNDIQKLLEKRKKYLLISLVVLPICTIIYEAFFLSLIRMQVSPHPPSPNPIFVSLFITTIICAPMVLFILAFAWSLFTLEKKMKKEITLEKYVSVLIVLIFTTSFVGLSVYGSLQYTPPPTYYCELNVTENSTAWTLKVSNLKSDEGLSIPLVSYQLEDGHTYELLEYGFLYQISDSPSPGYNITFVDNDQNNRFNNGDFFVIQKAGGIDGAVNSSDYFHLEFEDQSTPLTKIMRISEL